MRRRVALRRKTECSSLLAVGILIGSLASSSSSFLPLPGPSSASAAGFSSALLGTGPESYRGPYLPLRIATEQGDGLGAGRGHEGVDLFAPIGSDLIAVSDAIVLEAGTDSGRGNYVSIYSTAQDQSYNYLHLLEPSPVRAGERVAAGRTLGSLGCTGSCYGAHLHFEVRSGRGTYGTVLDPVAFLADLKTAPASTQLRFRRAVESRSADAFPVLP